MKSSLHSELIGTNRAAVRRYTYLSAGLVIFWFIAIFVLIGVAIALGGIRTSITLSKAVTDLLGAILIFIPIAVSFGAAAVYAYRFKGLFVSLALGMSAPATATIVLIGTDLANASEGDTPTSVIVLVLLGIGFIIAVGGYVFGRGTRLLKDTIKT